MVCAQPSLPYTFHCVVGTMPRSDEPDIVAPFMNQTTVSPLMLRQRMSALPLPSKSPVAAIDQLVTIVPTLDVDEMLPPCPGCGFSVLYREHVAFGENM